MISLADQVMVLAADLTEVLNSTVCDHASLRVAMTEDRFFLGQISEAPVDRPIASLRGDFISITEHESELFLMAQWRFGPSSSRRYLRTEWSQFGLYTRTKKQPMPAVRLEVETGPDPEAWNVAHLQVHGESQALGQVWGIRRARNPRALAKLHLPVGGFQYRPCLEDFLEFLIEEDLVPGKPGWKIALEQTRSAYRRSQLFSLIFKHPDLVREALTVLEEE